MESTKDSSPTKESTCQKIQKRNHIYVCDSKEFSKLKDEYKRSTNITHADFRENSFNCTYFPGIKSFHYFEGRGTFREDGVMAVSGNWPDVENVEFWMKINPCPCAVCLSGGIGTCQYLKATGQLEKCSIKRLQTCFLRDHIKDPYDLESPPPLGRVNI